MMQIDPTVMAEHKGRFEEMGRVVAEALTASKALLWFNEFAMTLPKEGMWAQRVVKPDALPGQLRVVAHSTPNVEAAQRYVDKALSDLRGPILIRAIELAQADLAAAPKLKEPLL